METKTAQKQPPCRGCLKRKRACHDTCRDYLEWKSLRAALKRKEYEIEEALYNSTSLSRQRYAIRKRMENRNE